MSPILGTRHTLAHMLGMTAGRIAQLIQTGVLPKPTVRGQYDLVACTRLYIQLLRQQQTDLHAQRTRWVKAKADKSELELRVRQGELTEVAKVQKQAFQTGRLVRDSMLQIPDRIAALVAADFDHSKTHALLTKEIKQALEALSAP